MIRDMTVELLSLDTILENVEAYENSDTGDENELLDVALEDFWGEGREWREMSYYRLDKRFLSN